MSVCAKCHRPLKNPSPSGFGPVCAKKVAPAPTGERDLFGFDLDRATGAAYHRLRVHIDGMAAQARIQVRAAFQLAREAA